MDQLVPVFFRWLQFTDVRPGRWYGLYLAPDAHSVWTDARLVFVITSRAHQVALDQAGRADRIFLQRPPSPGDG